MYKAILVFDNSTYDLIDNSLDELSENISYLLTFLNQTPKLIELFVFIETLRAWEYKGTVNVTTQVLSMN